MIHRDHRRMYESASGFGQLVHRLGPAHLTVGDVDLYCAKWIGDKTRVRLLEHKQPDQKLGKSQQRVLTDIDNALLCAVQNGLLLEGSGCFIVRGEISPAVSSRQEVKFSTRPTIQRIDGSLVFEAATLRELFDWINGSKDWEPRRNRPRWWQ